MDDRIRFEAHLHKVIKDADGEVTLTLKVPQIYQLNVMNLPTERTFWVDISESNQ